MLKVDPKERFSDRVENYVRFRPGYPAEVVEVLKAHWAGKTLDMQRSKVRAFGFSGRPLPVQQPTPPNLLRGGAHRGDRRGV